MNKPIVWLIADGGLSISGTKFSIAVAVGAADTFSGEGVMKAIEKSAYDELLEVVRFYAEALKLVSEDGLLGEPNIEPHLMPRPLGTLANEILKRHELGSKE